jgi:hypothetical protein
VERDLLILLKEAHYSETDIEKEVSIMNKVLVKVETKEHTCTVVELIEVNRNRITTRPVTLQRALRSKELKPFRFIFHKN